MVTLTKTKPRPKLTIIYRGVSTLKADPNNARTHSKAQVEKIRDSIREFGFTNPILLRDDNKTIGAGHGRWEAAKLEEVLMVPTITLPGLTAKQWAAYALADNRLPLDAGWNAKILGAEISKLSPELQALTGFSKLEFGKLQIKGFNTKLHDGTALPMKSIFAIIIDCDTEKAQEKLLEKLTGEGHKCKALVS